MTEIQLRTFVVAGAALLLCGCSGLGAAPGLAGAGSPPSPQRFLFNVRNYGAQGNGRADDTKAIGNALAAARAHGGGTVFFPKGVYDIVPAEGPFFVSSKITFLGEGRASVIRVADGAGQYNLIFGQHPGRLHDVAFRDLRFDQNPSGNPSGINFQTNVENVIQLYSFDRVTINHVAFDPEPGVQAIVAAGPDHPSGLVVSDCSFRFIRAKSSDTYYDESTVYTEAGHVQIHDNRFETTQTQNAITAIELHGGPDVDVANNVTHAFEIGMNLEESTNGYSEVPAAHFVVRGNRFEDVAYGIDLWSNAPRTLRDVAIDGNLFSFSQHHLYRNTWIGIGFQPGGRGQGLGGDFAAIAVDSNVFDFSLLQRQRIATSFSAAFNLDPDGRLKRFVASNNRMIDPPAMGIAIGNTTDANRSSDVVFDRNLIEGAGWDPKAPAGERAAVVLRHAAMRNVHVDYGTIVAPAKVAGVFSFIATPARGSIGVALRDDQVTPAGVLAHRVDKRVDTGGTQF